MNCWAVRADWDGEDKTAEFLEKGIWESNYKDDYTALINSIQAGDRIAIKSIRIRKDDLPFNNHDCRVSCMDIHAIGTVVENTGNGKLLKVDWQPQSEQKKTIYLYTYSPTVIRVAYRKAQKYIFENVEQNFEELDRYYKKRAESRKEQISDEFILSQFRSVSNFSHIENNLEYKELFLRFARYIHTTPMDWWITYSDQANPVRFGINNNYRGRNSTNGYVAAVGFDQGGTFYIPNDLAYFADETELVRLTQEKLEELEQIDFSKMDMDREPFIGYWPEDYEQKEQQEITMDTQPISKDLNRILFGAAGTGKTFNTINHALSIIENKPLDILETEDRTVLKERFDQYKAQGQIKFVTFHQSFSYEDFVEGIRAETTKNENGETSLEYSVVSGVFKNMCESASSKSLESYEGDYEEVVDSVINELVEKLQNGVTVNLQTKTGKQFALQKGTTNKNVIYKTARSGYSNSISLERVKNQLMLEVENRSDRPVYEARLVSSLQSQIEKKLLHTISEVKKPHVLIIDEINRGNISRIFGELITLIEDSKRQGAEEELSVTLPYSKEEFSVPDNVYLIGTMNSSDRSLTGLDIALRRRFTFIEMPPKPELLDGVEVKGLDIEKLLKVINQRIEVLLDRDHCIGHANFMSLKKQPNLETLSSIFKQKIIPQLQEYFFDDWSKINMVLNANGMLQPKAVERPTLFPNVNTEFESFLEEQKTWELVESAFDSIDSFTKIIKH